MAYGTDGAFGLRPYKLSGGGTDWAINEYPLASGYATAIYTNDPVISLADGTIGIGVAGSPIRGIFVGCKYTTTAGEFIHSAYWPASTTVRTGTVPIALIIDNPNLIVDVQEAETAGVAGTALALADRNLNANFTITAGSTVTGLSATFLANNSEAVTATLNLKILRLTPVPGDNEVVGNFRNWLCSINAHELKGGTGTAGL